MRYPSDDVFFGATAALQVGKEIWIGSVRGDRIARYPARKLIPTSRRGGG